MVAPAVVRCLEAGLALIPIPLGTKGPNTKGWNARERALFGLANAPRFAGMNAGLLHAWSRTCAVDVDDYAAAGDWLRSVGVNLEALFLDERAVQVKSPQPNRGKLLYRLPDDVGSLPSVKIASERGETLFELRCAAADGLSVQDVVAGAHPAGGEYELRGDPAAMPTLPGEVLALWRKLLANGRPVAAAATGASVWVPASTLVDLRSALCFIRADDRVTWVAIAHALHELGDRGRGLWLEWSQTSEKYDPADAAHVWDTIRAVNRTGYASVFARAQALGWVNPRARAAQDVNEAQWPPAAGTPVDVAGLRARLVALTDLDDAPPPAHWIAQVLPAGEVTLLGGHGGLGKSYLALLFALHLVTGRPIGPLSVKPCAVLFFSAEDGARSLRYRVARLCFALNVDPESLIGRLHLLDMSDVDAVLFRDPGRLANVSALTESFARLSALVEELDPGVIVIDGASDTFDADEVQRARVRAFMRALRRLAQPARAVLLLVHVNKATANKPKGGAEVTETYSGSTAWHNSARSRLSLTGEAGALLELRHEKANHGMKAPPIPVEFRDGVPRIVGEGASPAAAFAAHLERERDARDAETLCAIIADFAARGEYVTAAMQGGHTCYHTLREAPQFPEGTSAPRCRRLVRNLIDAGKIIRTTIAGPYRKPRDVLQVALIRPERAPEEWAAPSPPTA